MGMRRRRCPKCKKKRKYDPNRAKSAGHVTPGYSKWGKLDGVTVCHWCLERAEKAESMLVVAGMILDEDGRILMTQRADKGQCPRMWEIPGGKREPGESSSSAIIRELNEELGLDAIDLTSVARSTFNFFGSPFDFELWHVLGSEGVPRLQEGQVDMAYQDIDYAVNHLACCPSMYVLYPVIRSYITRTQG